MVDLEEVVLPGNARLLYHDNECYDWGTLGWIMSAGMVDVEDYKYFIMINSSVRGPYAPPYMPVGLALTAPECHLTDREVYVCSAGGQSSQTFIMMPACIVRSSCTCSTISLSRVCTPHSSIWLCGFSCTPSRSPSTLRLILDCWAAGKGRDPELHRDAQRDPCMAQTSDQPI